MTRALSETTTLDVMLRQETDYNNIVNTTADLDVNSHLAAATVNQMVARLEKIEDLCRLRHRETIVIATNYLVRYLHSTSQEEDLSRVALICFYMACKINEPAALPLRTLTDLFQRFFLLQDDTTTACGWEPLELKVCSALGWRLHPPTAMGFCDPFLGLKEPKKLRKRAQACLDTAFRANPWAFSTQHKSSSLAMAALLLAQRDAAVGLYDCVEWTAATSGRELTLALSFLQPHSKKKQRKRCVTSYQEEEERPRKKSRQQSSATTTTTLSPCLISTRSSCLQPPPSVVDKPCFLWAGSPRSALTMAE